MAEFTLHSFWQSGNSFKAAIMLELCGADWQPQRVAFFKGETRSPEYRDVNVMGEAPVLVHHRALGSNGVGDFTLSQSGAILHYLAKRFGQFGPQTEAEEYEILRWILFDNHKLTSYSATTRWMRTFQDKADDDPVVAFFLARTKGALKVLDAHMKGRDWVVADRPTIADLSMCAYQFWPAQIGYDPDEYPAVKAWLARLAALPRWKRAEELMPDGM
jgi:glutathione S-transferase